MKERYVKLNVIGLNRLFKDFKGYTVRIQSDVPDRGWVSVSLSELQARYEFEFANGSAGLTTPPVLNRSKLPDMMNVLKETVKVINQLKNIGYPIALIEFEVGKGGVPVMCEYDGVEYAIKFRNQVHR